MESWKKIAENELGIEMMEFMNDKLELGRMDFEVGVEKNYFIGDYNYLTKE